MKYILNIKENFDGHAHVVMSVACRLMRIFANICFVLSQKILVGSFLPFFCQKWAKMSKKIAKKSVRIFLLPCGHELPHVDMVATWKKQAHGHPHEPIFANVYQVVWFWHLIFYSLVIN